MLEESDRLLEYSEYMVERFGEYRLGVRLRGLSAACFEVVRSAPIEYAIHHSNDRSSTIDQVSRIS